MAENMPVLVVGIGASAGGLDPLKELFTAAPTDVGIAYVIVQHLSPDHKSMMQEILGRYTSMPVEVVTDRTYPKRDTVYLFPPGAAALVEDGVLVAGKVDRAVPRGSISNFFRTLGDGFQHRAVAIVLSGSGVDGSAGLESVAEHGGLVLAQGATAAFDSMPRSAVLTGKTHATLDPHEMPELLLAFLRTRSADDAVEALEFGLEQSGDPLRRIFLRLEEAFGIDFTHYKLDTIQRRITRRLALSQCETLEEYAAKLPEDRDELNQLNRDLLIGVTALFRDTEAWTNLAENVLPDVIDEAPDDGEVRIWVAGTSTGQEAYTLAALLHEEFSNRNEAVRVRIFATDVNPEAVRIASEGVYPESILEGMPPSRIEQMFSAIGDGNVKIRPWLRQMIVFSPHNLLTDPPFGRIDLVTCRNLLIYFDIDAQQQALGALHVALRMGGRMFLGPSESLGDLETEYEPLERKWKVFRKNGNRRPTFKMPFGFPRVGSRRTASSGAPSRAILRVYESLLEATAGAAALVDEFGCVVHLFGEISQYLTMPTGPATTNFVAMCTGDLKIAVSALVRRAKTTGERGAVRQVLVAPGEFVDVAVEPVSEAVGKVSHMLIRVSEEVERPAFFDGAEEVSAEARTRAKELEAELESIRFALQGAIEERELTNEELQASNEELLSSNEELQSTNEELHSVNEELHTVNAEYKDKLDELRGAYRDQDNLINATQIGILFTDDQGRLRFISPQAAQAFNVLPQDIGRDLRHLTTKIVGADVTKELDEVLAGGDERSISVTLVDGSRCVIRLAPYVDPERGPDGTVITLSDVTEIEAMRELAEHEEERLRRTLDYIPQGVWSASPEGGNTYVNEYFANWVAISGAEMKADGWAKNVHPDDLDELTERWTASLTTGAPLVIDSRLMHKSGTYRYLRIEGTPRRDEHGEIVEWLGTAVDIHDKKLADAELREFNEQLEALVATRTREVSLGEERLRLAGEHGTDGFWDWNLLTNEEYLSPRFKALFGYEDHEMENCPESWQAIMHPDDREKAEQAFIDHTEHAKPYNVVVRYYHKDGSVISVICRGVAFKDDEGRWARMIGTHTDVTAQAAAEEQLAVARIEAGSELSFIAMADITPLGIWLSNADGERHFFNKAWLSLRGVPLESESGSGWREAIHADDRDAYLQTCARALEQRVALQSEHRLLGADGEYLRVVETIAPHSSPSGVFLGQIGVLVDVTEQHRIAEQRAAIEERAQEANRLESLGVLAGGIAHDFNNILTGIIGPASTAKTTVERGSVPFAAFDDIERAGMRAAELCRQMLDFSGGGSISPTVLVVEDLVTDTISMLPAARRQNAELTVDVESDLPHVEADPTQLRRIIMNLVLNAIDSLGATVGTVAVALNVRELRGEPMPHLASGFSPLPPGHYVVVEVADTGSGIDASAKKRIFEPFFTTKFTGRGLGLAATRGAVRAARGTLELITEVGVGSTFRLWLPATRAPVPHERRTLPVFGTFLGTGDVLVVDDEPQILRYVGRLLEASGFTVVPAENGAKALELFEQMSEPPRFAIIDFTMPGMSGNDVAGALLEAAPKLPVLLMSGYSVEHTMEGLDYSRFTGFLRKPFEAGELLDEARRIVAKV